MINRNVRIAHQRTLRWAGQFGLVKPGSPRYGRLRAAKFAWLSALTQPVADLDDLQLAADWHSWLFFHDDLCDASEVGRDPDLQASFNDRLIAGLHGAALRADLDPLTVALTDVCQRLRRRAGEGWRLRFIRDVEAHLHSTRWEATNRKRNRVPGLARYVELRQLTGAVDTCFDLVGIASGIDSDSSFIESSDVRRLAATANRYICWTNDILGLSKEIKENNVNNLVLVLRKEFRTSLADATQRAQVMCEGEWRRFGVLESRLRAHGELESASSQQYVTGLRTWMTGHVDWYRKTARYAGSGGNSTSLASPCLVEDWLTCVG